MKFVIAVDLEGLACVVGQENMTLNESSNFDFAKRQAVREVNAAIKALFDLGATQVIVWDNHYGSLNLNYDELDERCDVLLGTGCGKRWPELDSSFSGVLMIGYHAMDNTYEGVLAHTFSSKNYQWMKVNGVEVGEMAIDGALAGEIGVPVIFVSSDDKGVTEALNFMPWIETVATKKGLGWNQALSKHPKRVADEIYTSVSRAVKRLNEMKKLSFTKPVSYQIRFKRMDKAHMTANGDSRWKYVDPFTLECMLEKMSDNNF